MMKKNLVKAVVLGMMCASINSIVVYAGNEYDIDFDSSQENKTTFLVIDKSNDGSIDLNEKIFDLSTLPSGKDADIIIQGNSYGKDKVMMNITVEGVNKIGIDGSALEEGIIVTFSGDPLGVVGSGDNDNDTGFVALNNIGKIVFDNDFEVTVSGNGGIFNYGELRFNKNLVISEQSATTPAIYNEGTFTVNGSDFILQTAKDVTSQGIAIVNKCAQTLL